MSRLIFRVTSHSSDAVKMYLQKQETPYYSLLPAKARRSKHPRPLYSARYAPWYLYNPSFNFFAVVHASALLRNVIFMET